MKQGLLTRDRKLVLFGERHSAVSGCLEHFKGLSLNVLKYCKAFLICFIEEYNCQDYMQVGHSLQIKTLGADVKNKF